MATSKVKIAEEILRRLRKYSIDSDIDERELMISTHETLSTIIRNRYFETKGMECQEVSGVLYYTLLDREVKKSDSDTYYIDIPSTTVELPFGVEIKRVGTRKGMGFVPVQLGFNDLYANLESSTLEGQIGYYKQGNAIEFSNMTYSNKPDAVDISMVLPFDALDEDDAINIPQDMLDQAIDIVFNKYAKTLGIPPDEIANSIDN